MIIRKIEYCPCCKQRDPWRKYATRVVNGERRIYVACRRCGKHEVVVYRS